MIKHDDKDIPREREMKNEREIVLVNEKERGGSEGRTVGESEVDKNKILS